MDDAAGRSGLRERMFPLIWMLLYPLRQYLKRFPIQRGKGILLRHVIMPSLPGAGAEFELHVPPGAARVGLRYRETLGVSSLLYGTFELAELNFVAQYLEAGDKAMDIGANVGLFSVVMGTAVGPLGAVFAFEPVPLNVSRLEKNLRKNTLDNVSVFPVALGVMEGQMRLHMATDPAYPSLQEVQGGFASGAEVLVQVRSLDSVWAELGCPDIALVKIDVEGSEADVLQGASRFLSTCCPILLVEANSVKELDVLRDQLCGLGYRHVRPDGFAPMNHLFIFPVLAGKNRSLTLG